MTVRRAVFAALALAAAFGLVRGSLADASSPSVGEVIGLAAVNPVTKPFLLLFREFGLNGSSVLPAPGALDTTFGSDGFAMVPYGKWAGAAAAAVQPNGEIVTAGETKVGGRKEIIATRFNPDGTLDSSFGRNGIVTVKLGNDAGVDSGAALALQQDGKIVIAGTAVLGRQPEFIAVRLEPSGKLDPSFGRRGVAAVQLGQGAIANAVILDPRGHIVLGGVARVNGVNYFAVARLTARGLLDRSFGTGGATIFGPAGAAWGMVLEPDRGIVLGGVGVHGTANAFMAARVLPNGALDPRFGSDGVVTVPIGSNAIGQAVALTSNGEIVVSGDARTSDGGAVATIELTGNGSLVKDFGVDGIAEFHGWGVSAIVVDRFHRIVLAGTGAAVARLNPDGTPDARFGKNGATIYTEGSSSAANGLAIDPKTEKYVLSGAATIDGVTQILVLRVSP